jgi:RNA polymerase sigma-70 factor (ECF subfamily)
MVRAQAGDADAYRELLSELQVAIERYLRTRFGDPDLVEECAQESLLAVHRARDSYDAARRFRPWLFTIVRHKAIDMLRRRGVRDVVRAESEVVETAPSEARDDPADRLEAAQLLKRLDPKYRDALWLTKIEGLSIGDAARRVGVTEAAMKTRVHRAIRAVRRQLDAEAEDEP